MSSPEPDSVARNVRSWTQANEEYTDARATQAWAGDGVGWEEQPRPYRRADGSEMPFDRPFGDTGGDPRFDGLRHLQIQPVEPLQAIGVDTSGVDGLENLENVRNRLRNGLNSGEERSVVRKHGP